MPRINDNIQFCVLYLYPSEDAARKGTQQGGTGFLYGIPVDENSSQYRVFVVTCRHLLTNKHIYLRFNASDGGVKIIRTKKTDWLIDETEDLGIYPFRYYDEIKANFVRKGPDTISPELISRLNIGPGDDIFIVGRFIQHEGKQRNTPVVRFGNLAMMPLEPVYNRNINLEVYCYLVDLRIREGFSGSPVFIKYENRISKEGGQMSGPWFGELLLGVSWGGFKGTEQVRYQENGLPLADYNIMVYEDMACVTPVERIDALINRLGDDLN